MRIILDPDASHVESHHEMKMSILTSTNELVKTHDYDKLTISDICHEAHISRQTFYKCFDGKNAILVWYITSIHREYFGAIGQTLTWSEAIRLSFRFAHRRVDFGVSFFKSSAASEAVETIAQSMRSILEQDAKRKGVVMEAELRFQIEQWSWLFSHAIAEWNASAQAIPGETFGRYLESTVPRRLHEALQLVLDDE